MKLIYALSFITLTTLASAQNCSNLVSNIEFQTTFNTVAAQVNDHTKLEKAYTVIAGKCFTASQVKLLTQLFSTDAYKLEFSKVAYGNTFDQVNFYDVYDAFSNFSTAFRLHDYINGIADTSIEDPIEEQHEEEETTEEIIYPDINYPSPNKYAGLSGCSVPMADGDFNHLVVDKVYDYPEDADRIDAAHNMMSTYCLSMAQVMMVASQIKLESNRLQFMKDALIRTYDIANYGFAAAVFNHVPYQNDWLSYCSAAITDWSTPDVPPCDVSSEKFGSMKNAINDLTWSDEKREALFGFLNDEGNCFSIDQIRWFMDYYSFDDDRMEVAKAAYARCLEPNDYYKLQSEFTFGSSKEDFLEWLDTQ